MSAADDRLPPLRRSSSSAPRIALIALGIVLALLMLAIKAALLLPILLILPCLKSVHGTMRIALLSLSIRLPLLTVLIFLKWLKPE